MTKFLIVQADYPCGRGSRGRNLYRFLSLFHGRQAVKMVSTKQLLASDPLTTDVLFIGMPSQLDKPQLAKLRYRQAVLFDYHDNAGPIWLDSNRELLLSITNRYFKPWHEPGWEYGLQMGVLPIRRHFRLKLCLRCRDALLRLGAGSERMKYDVAFIGDATGIGCRYYQRIEWLREVKAAGDRYSFWGGIVARERARDALQRQFSDLPHLCYAKGRVGFLSYFANLARSRVALAPAGNARWTYRHYEAIYAGAVVVSTDFRQIQTLIPLPLDNIVHVPDGASVLPAIDQALAMRETSPEIVEENVRFLERYLRYGDYCPKKPELMERFLGQLAG